MNNELLAAYKKNLGDRHYAAHYLSTARKFLEYAEDRPMDKDVVRDYMEKLKGKGRSSSTQVFVFGVIRRLYRVSGLEWEWRFGEGPVVDEEDVNAPAMDPEDVRAMIAAAREGKLSQVQTAFLAVSTIYGLRRTEIVGLGLEEVDIKEGVLYVRTAKKGRNRLHGIPEAIVWALEGHDWSETVSVQQASVMFKYIEHAVGWDLMLGVGWHAIRRTLDTLLLHELPEAVVSDFMRWKKQGASMAQRYHATKFVSHGEERRIRSKQVQETDNMVFEAHPFIKDWEMKVNLHS